QVYIKLFFAETRRRIELSKFFESFRPRSRFVFNLSLRTLLRAFSLLNSARGDLEKLAAGGVPVLPDERYSTVSKDGQASRSARMTHYFAYDFATVIFQKKIAIHIEDQSVENTF